MIENMESQMREMLFGNESPLANLGLHKGAQDNFITALSLVGFEKMQAASSEDLRAFFEANYDTESRSFQFQNQESLFAFLGISEDGNSFESFFSLASQREDIGV